MADFNDEAPGRGEAGPEADEFKAWAAGQPTSPNHLGLVGVTLKLGRRVCKTASLAKYGNPETGELKKRHLKLLKLARGSDGRFPFEAPDVALSFENEEIDRLRAFLNDELDGPGQYRIIDAATPLADLIDAMRERPDDVIALVAELAADTPGDKLAEALSRTPAGLTQAEAAVILHRRDLLGRAKETARDSGSTETDMQRLIGDAWWLFGGRYIGVLPRRQVLQLDEHDIPLVCSDQSLHIVELKGPVIPALIKRHRNHWIVGNEVHEAAMQAVNYLRSADELGAATQRNLKDELGIEVDLRRSFATVVIGHRNHIGASDLPGGQIDICLRTYNAALNRVQVVTYDQLFDSAERALEFRDAL